MNRSKIEFINSNSVQRNTDRSKANHDLICIECIREMSCPYMLCSFVLGHTDHNWKDGGNARKYVRVTVISTISSSFVQITTEVIAVAIPWEMNWQ